MTDTIWKRLNALGTLGALAIFLPLASHAAAPTIQKLKPTLVKPVGITHMIGGPVGGPKLPPGARTNLRGNNLSVQDGSALFALPPQATPFYGKPIMPKVKIGGGAAGSLFASPLVAAAFPSGKGGKVVVAGSNWSGFDGLTNYDQLTSGTGNYANSQYTLEPPDLGMAVGNGYVVEMVNNALAVYDTKGKQITPTIPTNQFFGASPEFVQATGAYGTQLSDIRGYYDAPTKRFFLEEWGFVVDPFTGAILPDSFINLAVSQTSDPTGAYFVYHLNTTTNDVAGVPVIPDYTYIGADKNGIYLSSNNFEIGGTGAFQGVTILALPKAALEAGNPFLINGFLLPPSIGGAAPVDQVFGLAPSTTPPGDQTSAAAGGTEFLLSSLDPNGTLDNRLTVWAITNTSSLATSAPTLNLSYSVISTEAYGMPPAATQKAGLTPLRDFFKDVDPIEKLNTDDDRIFQLTYAGGKLYSALTTVFLTSGPARAGIAYFEIKPTVTKAGVLSAAASKQSYVGLSKDDVFYPSLGVNSMGDVVMTFTLSGPDYFPSAAYVSLNEGDGVIHLAAPGAFPDDGFTGYPSLAGGNGVARWGDYQVAYSDEQGNIWLAAQYIPTNTGVNKGNNARDLSANWGTFISQVAP